MKKYPLLLGLFVSIIILFSPQIASADSNHWVDESYNFRNIKNILIICTIPEEAKDDVFNPYLPITYPKELMITIQKKNSSLTAHTLAEAIQLLDQETDGEYTRLLNANNPEALSLLNKFISDYYDATINVSFLKYNHVFFSLLSNSRPMQLPNVRIDFSVIDSKRGNIIFGRNEARSGDGASTFKGISTRMANNFTNKLIELIEK